MKELIVARSKTLFELGQVYSTPGAVELLSHDEILSALARHVRGDWGSISREDLEENDFSVRNGHRILSQYKAKNGEKFWIITEADRSATTVLLPIEY
jgi:hypothetical protein